MRSVTQIALYRCKKEWQINFLKIGRVMDQGKIIEAGSHDSLLSQGGLYARYWNRQSGGFIGLQPAAE